MSLLIEYPPAEPTHTVTIKSPILGDSYTDAVKVNMHIMMSADIVTTKRTPSQQKLLMTFRDVPSVCDDQVTALDEFLAVVLGRDVRVRGLGTDMWVGKIITNPIEVIHVAKGRAEFTLELIGLRTSTDYLLRLEDDTGYLLLEDGNYLLLEDAP
jgi:hypothetical protein